MRTAYSVVRPAFAYYSRSLSDSASAHACKSEVGVRSATEPAE